MDQLVLTLDVDWAPDFIIDWVADKLIERHVKATWFVTHSSPAINRLREYPDLFELGIHPNFLSGSTHGETISEVLQYCLGVVPDATSVRVHGLAWSSQILEAVMKAGIKVDVSLFVPYAPCLSPIDFRYSGSSIVRIPFFWEDDFELEKSLPCWQLEPLLRVSSGLKVFNFHPVHIFLNSKSMTKYNELRLRVSNLRDMTRKIAENYIMEQDGVRTSFETLVEYISRNQNSINISGIYRLWKNSGRLVNVNSCSRST